MNDFLNIIYPIFLTVLTGVLAYIGRVVVKLVPKLISFIVAKIGLTNYQKTKLVALDVWNVIEEHFRINGIVGDVAQAKVKMFESLIKQKVPGITDKEIELFRQAIAGEVNKDKPVIIKAIEEPIIVIADPKIKYVNADGIELKPIP